jgi:hypothetical protein
VQLVASFDSLLNASRVMYKLTEVRSRLLLEFSTSERTRKDN